MTGVQTCALPISAESGCIITAATVDVLLYQYSVLLSIPLALVAGSLTIAATVSFKVARSQRKRPVDRNDDDLIDITTHKHDLS